MQFSVLAALHRIYAATKLACTVDVVIAYAIRTAVLTVHTLAVCCCFTVVFSAMFMVYNS
jgi:hypothetical protein